jgi:hypothetical protein
MPTSFASQAVTEIVRLLSPLRELRTPSGAARVVRELGWDFEGEVGALDLGQLFAQIEALSTLVARLGDADTDAEQEAVVLDLIEAVPPAVDRLRTDLPALAGFIQDIPGLAGGGNVAGVISRRVFDWLFHRYLESYLPRAYAVLHVLGVAETVDEVRVMRWERLPRALTDFGGVAEEIYGWRTGFDGDELMTRLALLARAFLWPGGLYTQPDEVHDALGRAPNQKLELRIPLYQAGRHPDTYEEAGLNLSPTARGLALYPYLTDGLAPEATAAEGWELTVLGGADLASGFGVTLDPPAEVAVSTHLLDGTPPGQADTRVEVRLTKASPAEAPTYLFGTAATSHLAAEQVGVTLIAAAGASPELTAELEVLGIALRVSAGDGDGFIQKILAGVDITTTCDLGVGWSSAGGVYFRGSGALELLIPIHQTLGPIRIDSLLVGVAADGGLEATLAATFGVELGPVSATVQEMGLRIPVALRDDNGGNLGPIDASEPAFKPPVGAGLSVDASGIVGGGFLEIDTEEGRYTGVLGLKLGELGITAIGLIQTELPDGLEGFSMLISIGVIFNPAIQLSFGFTLSGVGGLIGINRDMLVEELQRGIKNHTLDSILFPDPATVVENVPRILSDMDAVFPAAEGRFVVGPMVKLGWGTPTLISADIGIFLSLPDPVSAALMGQVAASFPTPDAAVISLHLDVLGVLDMGQKMASFQSSLYDSRVLQYTLLGDSAFLLGWGESPAFALSIGGFHPAFDPPPPPVVFSGLERLSLAMSAGSDFSIGCSGYLALTTGSLQFGAEIDLHAEALGATVDGFLGFDALFYFSPFSMSVSIGGGVAVRYKGHRLADIRLGFDLSGPTPWDARGTAHIGVLCFDVDIGFHFTWGSREERRVPSADPLPLVAEALGQASSWASALPAGRVFEQLRGLDEGEAGDLVVHPTGTLEVRQHVAPLGLTLQSLGNAPVTGHDRITVTRMRAGDLGGGEADDVQDYFARGQFEKLSSQEKLSLPSFEKMTAGARSERTDEVRLGGETQSRELTYESILLAENLVARRQRAGRKRFDGEGAHLRNGGARGRMTAVGLGRFAAAGAVKVEVGEQTWTLVRKQDLGPLDATLPRMTRTQADQVLAERLAADPSLAGQVMVVPSDEVEEAA